MNLDISALAGEAEMITIFDDFNVERAMAGANNDVPRPGWIATDRGGAASALIGINDRAVEEMYLSSVRLDPGTAVSTGNHVAVVANVGAAEDTDQRMFWPNSGGDADAMDNQTFVFAIRIGLEISAGTTWDASCFVGFANSADTTILELVAASGILDAPGASLLGFHIASDGHIDLVSVRGSTALADGTNFTQVLGTGWNTGLTTGVRGAVWFDLALRCDITDWSDATANGVTTGYIRMLSDDPAPGRRTARPSSPTTPPAPVWHEAGQLLNSIPRDGAGTFVPTWEIVNGAGTSDVDLLVDWQVHGLSRPSYGWNVRA